MAAGLFATSTYAASFDEALTGGKANMDMRLRYETVDDSTNKDAEAGTLRTRIGYQTGDYQDFAAFAEFEDVRTVMGLDDYSPQNSGFAAVADPEVTQVNQAIISYKGISDTTAKLGRQRLILDNARHIGNVGWRQNEQTFDAVSLVITSISNTTITYAFLDKVNGITSTFDTDVSDHLVNATYSGFARGNITGYAYLLEDDGSNAETDIYGLRFNGQSGLSEGNKLLYTAELATQSTDNNDALYTFIEGGVQYGGVTTKLGYEVLGSDDGAYGFQTPLATKHAFNGWADQFLSTPADGLQDIMLSIAGMVADIKLLGVFHDFSADQGGDDYGSEVDLQATKNFAKRYTVGVKYAAYSADTIKTDTEKLWLWGELKI